MAWWTIYRNADGVCLGHTSVEPTAPPAGSTVLQHAERQDQVNRWDEATRAWVAIPAPVLIDRLQDLAQHPYLANVWQRLTAAQRTQLRKAVVWLLGTHRYRQPTEEVALDVDPSWPTDPANAAE